MLVLIDTLGFQSITHDFFLYTDPMPSHYLCKQHNAITQLSYVLLSFLPNPRSEYRSQAAEVTEMQRTIHSLRRTVRSLEQSCASQSAQPRILCPDRSRIVYYDEYDVHPSYLQLSKQRSMRWARNAKQPEISKPPLLSFANGDDTQHIAVAEQHQDINCNRNLPISQCLPTPM